MGAVADSSKAQPGTAAATAVAVNLDGSTKPKPSLAQERKAHVGDVDLVLAGGGVKGIAHVGAIKALHDAGYDRHPRIAGTSVGAIVGALLAKGQSPCEVWQELYRFDFSKVADHRPTQIPVLSGLAKQVGHTLRVPRLGPLSDFLGLRDRQGSHRGLVATRWLGRIFSEGPQTFGDLADLAGRDIDDRPPLVILATDVTLGRLVQFPRDFRLVYGVDPRKQSIFHAVRASMSIPLYFEPYAIEPVGRRDRKAVGNLRTSHFVDGGVLANFAVDVLDRAVDENLSHLRPRWPTFGVTLLRGESAARVGGNLRDSIASFGEVDDVLLGNLGPFADALIGTAVIGQDEMAAQHWWMARRTIRVDTRGFDIVDFDITQAGKRELYARGYEATQQFLSTTWKVDGKKLGFDGRGQFPLPAPVPADQITPCKDAV